MKGFWKIGFCQIFVVNDWLSALDITYSDWLLVLDITSSDWSLIWNVGTRVGVVVKKISK